MGKKVLIANDNLDIVKIIKARLKPFDYELIVTTDGRQAVDLAREHKPDVKVLDYHMPILTGVEVSEQIKKDPQLQNTPVLF